MTEHVDRIPEAWRFPETCSECGETYTPQYGRRTGERVIARTPAVNGHIDGASVAPRPGVTTSRACTSAARYLDRPPSMGQAPHERTQTGAAREP